ncbi:MAG TPA: 5-bromo-4-chloroindolyl phosphate hydrolysis family protein [Candidatus Mediterraneibacter faecigallinarum]|uniref:5-bromo-4-chloroindolyl phosphate hydrolysis family protein n=1 Tax=Candidatus Mediterraneibacter faecigallinarum TaxID=2838669 RepID=A0A9D2NXE3_9FIRM|nr:5-bromo-4-chloroindolyl phosphate hydrolysis family protein [Candidatus Mediterraneibacter faecigallinarum]
MINNDWERFGDEIRRTIQNAVDSRDFSRLNQTISDTVNQAVDNVSRGIRNGGWYRENPMDRRWDGGMPGGKAADGPDAYEAGRTAAKPKPEKRGLYLKGTSTKIGGAFLAATGYIFGISTVIMLLAVVTAGAASGWGTGLTAGAVALGIFTLLFGWMAAKGTGMVCSVGRFRKYVGVLREREYCDVKELAQKTGRSVKAVVKDLKKMIQKGWFRQGHLDEQGTCLMVSDEAYRQYTGLMERMSREKAEREAAAERARQEYSKLSPEVQKIVSAGDEYVRKIREANDAIPGEEISAKISRMEMLVDRIFDRVEQNPESVDDIRKLMEYYLPTTIKLLEAYEELDAQPVQGENIISSKREIEKTLDTLNTAFEKLLDDLFQDTAWDVSSDISVLNMMLAQEGLTEDGLTGKKKN